MFSFADGVSPDPAKTSTRVGALVKALGGRRVALVGEQTDTSATALDQVAASVRAAGGLSVVYRTNGVPHGSTDLDTVVQRIARSRADAVYSDLLFTPSAALAARLARAGVRPKVAVFPTGYDPGALAVDGIDGAVIGIPFVPFEADPPPFGDYAHWLDGANGHVGLMSAVGWLAADAFIAGLTAAGPACPTRVAFIDDLRLTKRYTAGGFVAPVDFAAVFGKAAQCTYYVRVEDRRFVPLFGAKPLCGKPLTVRPS
jgi:ABC-type branched-subunit amino acid transport system substrate-binding protein